MKKSFKITLDPILLDIATEHCCNLKISRSHYITSLIAGDLNIPINNHGDVDNELLKDYLLSSIDKKINDLKLEKQRILQEA